MQYTSALQAVTDQATNPPSALAQFVRAVAVDFSTICSSSNLVFTFTAGEINYLEVGGIDIWIGGTATGINGTDVYSDGGDPTTGAWVSLLPVPRDFTVFQQSFANPNPAGISWVKVVATPGSGTFAGIRNWSFTINVV